jgi:hypothetical protein
MENFREKLKEYKERNDIFKILREKYLKEKVNLMKEFEGKFILFTENGVIYSSNLYYDAEKQQSNIKEPSYLVYVK